MPSYTCACFMYLTLYQASHTSATRMQSRDQTHTCHLHNQHRMDRCPAPLVVPGAGSSLTVELWRLADTETEQGVLEQLLRKEEMPSVKPLQGPVFSHSPSPVVVPCGPCASELQLVQASPAQQVLAPIACHRAFAY